MPSRRARAVRALRDPWILGLAAVMAVGLGLRLWGISYGLPLSYNIDERAHFVPRAVDFFTGDLNPDYQLNPSGYMYMIAAAFLIVYRDAGTVLDTFASDPGEIFLISRVVSALLSVVAIGLLYAVGARLFDRRVGLLAAALLSFTFLPVFYGHFALNDAPALAGVTLSLYGAAGVVRHGRKRDYLIAGIGAGIAGAIKYNAGLIIVAVAGAALVRIVRDRERGRIAVGVGIAAVATFAGFAVLDPYAIRYPAAFLEDVDFLRRYFGGEMLLGERNPSGHRYFLWSLTWGFGWVPMLGAIAGGALLILRRRWWPAALVLLPILVFSLVYLGDSNRVYARYILHMYPVLALLAALAAVGLITWVAGRWPRARLPVTVLVLAAAFAQSAVTVPRNNVVLSREDTRQETRDWMEAHVPAGDRIALEPTAPREWMRDEGLPWEEGADGSRYFRWDRWVRSPEERDRLAEEHPGARHRADFQNYQYTLWPGLIDFYREEGICWVVTSSMQRGRAELDPSRVPEAIDYYERLADQGELVFEALPVEREEDLTHFQFDWTFNYYPGSFQRPGPIMRVYRLSGGNCGPSPIEAGAQAATGDQFGSM
jgi:hypothetical protein